MKINLLMSPVWFILSDQTYSAGQKFRTFYVMTFLWPPCGRGTNFEQGGVWKYQFFIIFIIRGPMLDRVKGPSEHQNRTFLNFP